MQQKLLFFFIDGLGLGDNSRSNPFVHAKMNSLNNILGQKLLKNININQDKLLCKGIDACLLVDGIPQSATGQTALFTGINAAQHLGYHLPAFPNDALKKLIYKNNLIKYAVAQNRTAVFANSYTDHYFDLVKQGKREHSVTTLCTMSANLPLRNVQDLLKRKAVHWDITRQIVNEQQNPDIPVLLPEQAAKDLVSLCQEYDLVVFESFLPDLIGHSKEFKKKIEILEILDSFIGNILTELPSQVTFLFTSDHGNIEDSRIKNHTKNPVPLFVYGPGKLNFQSVNSLTDIYGACCQTII